MLSKYVGRKDLWWFPSGDVTPAVEDADGWNCRKPIIGRSVAASLVRAYVREHLLVGREEIQSIYAPSVVAAPSIKQQNPFRHIFAGSGARRAATALPVIGDSSSEEEMREPPETVPSAVQRDDASNPTVPVDGWGGTAEDDGLGAMVLGPTASPKRSTRASPEKSMAEAMRRLTSGRSLGFGAPVKPSAPSSLVPVPDTRIRRIKFGKLERLRETLLQVLIQLQLSAMTSVAQKHKSSTGSVVRDDTTVLDPVPTRVIQDIQNTLSMAFFSVDASLTPDLITMIGPLPPSESAFTVESVVMLSIVPLCVG